MEFKRYRKIKKYSEVDTVGIEVGTCYVFPKIDGTNATSWLDSNGQICGGSRNRELSVDNDNGGFFAWLIKQSNIIMFHLENPSLRLYGEWLIPHSLKTYRDDSWRNFYIFDVYDDATEQYLPYDTYKELLEKYNIEYIPPLGIVKNGNYESFIHIVNRNNYLIEDGKGIGEGIVIKNYDFVNKFGKQEYAKIVTSAFKEKLHKEMGAPVKEFKPIETEIAEKYTTESRVTKIFTKIEWDTGGWQSHYIPRLLETVYYDIITEEMYNILKEYKNPVINFGTLKQNVILNIKKHKPELF